MNGVEWLEVMCGTGYVLGAIALVVWLARRMVTETEKLANDVARRRGGS